MICIAVLKKIIGSVNVFLRSYGLIQVNVSLSWETEMQAAHNDGSPSQAAFIYLFIFTVTFPLLGNEIESNL